MKILLSLFLIFLPILSSAQSYADCKDKADTILTLVKARDEGMSKQEMLNSIDPKDIPQDYRRTEYGYLLDIVDVIYQPQYSKITPKYFYASWMKWCAILPNEQPEKEAQWLVE